ncbi:transposase [Metabacillus fastidiosus]|uniref:Transposase n=2 Tax=Metabacillus fastidiosus TaxID=1458 RepID=A0ABU6NSC7_9BACI|nr:transposase [Metabacillus fastidiosus]MED4400054.1 transposase [Metabacillus fastidiosus]
MQRRKHSEEFKKQLVQEAMETGNKALVARRHQLSPNLIHKWMKAFQEDNDFSIEEAVSSSEVKQLEEENDRLKKLLGEKDLEIAILRDVLKKKNPHLLKRLK